MNGARRLVQVSKGIKILATIGPASISPEVVREMIRNGVSGFRINMAFGNPETWSSYVKNIREASVELDTVVSIIADIPGPQVRTGEFQVIEVKKGDIVYLTRAEQDKQSGEVVEIPVHPEQVFDVLEPGDTILYGDGEVELSVLEVSNDRARCLVKNHGVLKPGKKIVVLGKELPTGFLSDRDVELVKYSCSENLSYIALSYVRSELDVQFVRDLLTQFNCDVGIISKIETPSGVRNAGRIADLSDAILIARGDLGVHFPIEDIPLLQEQITRISVEKNKPVIVATDILDSMIENNRPSRSDVVGLYNIVHSLADAILLTNETAIGKYPVEAVKWARIIADTAYKNTPPVLIEQSRKTIKPTTLLEKYVQGLVYLAESLDGVILVYTKTGRTPPLISKLRPRTRVYVGSWNRKLLEKYTIYYGVNTVDLSSKLTEQDDYEKGVEELYVKTRDQGYLKPGDVVIKSYAKRGVNVHEIRVEVVI
ncbi:MAG: pyruvate kinase [Desulfurococcaceae archaeon]